MADIILDANALKLLLNDKYINRVIEKCEHIFISKHWKKVYKSIRELQMAYNTFNTNIKKLEGKLHESSGRTDLPDIIKRGLERKNASDDDFEISQIAYDRREKSGQNVFLVSDDYHIFQLELAFRNNGIIVEKQQQELERLLKYH